MQCNAMRACTQRILLLMFVAMPLLPWIPTGTNESVPFVSGRPVSAARYIPPAASIVLPGVLVSERVSIRSSGGDGTNRPRRVGCTAGVRCPLSEVPARDWVGFPAAYNWGRALHCVPLRAITTAPPKTDSIDGSSEFTHYRAASHRPRCDSSRSSKYAVVDCVVAIPGSVVHKPARPLVAGGNPRPWSTSYPQCVLCTVLLLVRCAKILSCVTMTMRSR
mmetsp:Transcript_20664/g.43849  ORF Transcript_20664/g.43849 Transcript_20664/m.43849 type:complete len:220 (+) Transcript_20664:446-1105(+)